MEQKPIPVLTPKRIDAEEFEVILKAITAGETIMVDEMEDVVAYANAVPEMVALIKALSNGYKVLLGRIAIKSKVNGALKRQLEAAQKRNKKEGSAG